MKKNITVLVADDHLFMRESLRAMLEKNPIVKKIFEVENGRQAIDVLGNNAIDVALMDVRMPVTDGFEVIEYVHKHKIILAQEFLSLSKLCPFIKIFILG